MRWSVLPLLLCLAGCDHEAPRDSSGLSSVSTPAPSASAAPAARALTISIIGTNDLHGRLFALPLLGGYVENVRRARAADGGGVLLVDAGDMFQGTLESNLPEGKPIRDAYAALGYAAVTVGNHEFDFGPLGPDSTPQKPSDDPRGALKALAKDSPFPFLIANVNERSSGRRVDWPGMPASTIAVVAGVPIGIIGVTTEETLRTTIAPNVADLTMAPVTEAIVAEARALRERGARAVVVLAHAGGKCKSFSNDAKADQCETDAEIFKVARALPAGAVDAIVAGHTHAGVAHDVAGIPIIEQHSYGVAFGRVDLRLEGDPARVIGHVVHPPRELCPGAAKPDFVSCEPGDYEGAKVARLSAVQSIIQPAIDGARDKRAQPVGPALANAIKRKYDEESALGNLFADLLAEGVPQADVALMNGGGLRADLPAGALTYGALFEAFPFDNRVATARISAGDLKRLLRTHFAAKGGGILSISGVRVRASCKGGEVAIAIERSGGRKKAVALRDDEMLVLAASDFMLLGGDDFWAGVTPGAIDIRPDVLRDVFETGLKKRKSLSPADVFDAKLPRLDLEKPRPLTCSKP